MPPLATGEQTTILRWMVEGCATDTLHVTALMPGSKKLNLELSQIKGGNDQINVKKPTGKNRRITVTGKLNPK